MLERLNDNNGYSRENLKITFAQRCMFCDYRFLLTYCNVDKLRFQVNDRNAVEVNIENERFTVFTLSLKPEIWKFRVAIWQTTSKNCSSVRAARAAR